MQTAIESNQPQPGGFLANALNAKKPNSIALQFDLPLIFCPDCCIESFRDSSECVFRKSGTLSNDVKTAAPKNATVFAKEEEKIASSGPIFPVSWRF